MTIIQKVSIPHRHSKNQDIFKQLSEKMPLMFQFLIGTLKTGTTAVACEKLNRFQFLIGTLKTRKWASQHP